MSVKKSDSKRGNNSNKSSTTKKTTKQISKSNDGADRKALRVDIDRIVRGNANLTRRFKALEIQVLEFTRGRDIEKLKQLHSQGADNLLSEQRKINDLERRFEAIVQQSNDAVTVINQFLRKQHKIPSPLTSSGSLTSRMGRISDEKPGPVNRDAANKFKKQ